LIDSLFARAHLIARFQESPLQPHLSDLACILNQQGYSRNVIRTYLCSAEKFGRWLTTNKFNPSDVDEGLIGHYIADIRRHRAHGGSRENLKARAGLSYPVRVLRERQVIPAVSVALPNSAVDTWLLKFEQHLVQVVGAAVNTRKRYLSLVKRFVDQQFGDDSVHDHIVAFVTKEAATKKGLAGRPRRSPFERLFAFLYRAGKFVLVWRRQCRPCAIGNTRPCHVTSPAINLREYWQIVGIHPPKAFATSRFSCCSPDLECARTK
jgi:hypothetical protein